MTPVQLRLFFSLDDDWDLAEEDDEEGRVTQILLCACTTRLPTICVAEEENRAQEAKQTERERVRLQGDARRRAKREVSKHFFYASSVVFENRTTFCISFRGNMKAEKLLERDDSSSEDSEASGKKKR